MKIPHFSRPGAVGAVMLTVFCPAFSKAAILSQWTFNSTTVAPSNVAAGLTASDFTTPNAFSGTVGPSGSVEGVGGTDPFVFGASTLPTTEAAAITNQKVFNVTLTPTVGNVLSLSQISFSAWANTNFNDGAYNFFVRNDLTGATTLGTFSSTVELANATAPGAASQYTLNLSGFAALQNISTATTFTIGVYVDSTPVAGNLRIDSLQLDGSVGAIPEPSSALVSALGLGLLAIRRRVR